MKLLVSVSIQKTAPPRFDAVKIDPRIVREYTPLSFPPNLVVKLPYTIYAGKLTELGARLEVFLDGKGVENAKLYIARREAITKTNGFSQTVRIGLGKHRVVIDIPETLSGKLQKVAEFTTGEISKLWSEIMDTISGTPEIYLDIDVKSTGRISMVFSIVSHVIWHCDRDAQKVYELSTTDFSVVKSASSPGTSPSGIGGDLNVIWHYDEDASEVYELSPQDLSIVAHPIYVPQISGIGGEKDVIWHCNISEVKVYELSPTDFSVIRSATSPGSYPMGIGGKSDVIWHCDYSGVIYELSTEDFSVVRNADAPACSSGVGGSREVIWLCEIDTYKAYELSPTDFSVVKSGPCPSTYPTGIGGC